MTQPGAEIQDDVQELVTPGSARWYLNRLTFKLLTRQFRYDKLERYALGQHDFPNGDKRFVMALRELQRKCRTNYCELVILAVTERMKVDGFQFGPESQADPDAKAIWNGSNMGYQSPVAIRMAATFGDTYILVSPPDDEDDNGLPQWTVEDPRMCIVEPDPTYPSKALAGFKMWQDDVAGHLYGVIYLPDQIRLYQAPAVNNWQMTDVASLTHILTSRNTGNGWKLVDIQDNPAGEVPLVRGNWQPAFGALGRSEHEGVLDIQDRINQTVLDRLVISKSQAYNQRWMTGVKPGEKNFRPGADMVWAVPSPDANFGQFDAADIEHILAAVRDDVGDMAAISQTPATYLMNRMVNVSGDTLTQDQSALVTKVGIRSDAMGWMYENAMRISMKLMGNTSKANEVEVCVLWHSPEIRDIAKLADMFSKFTAGGLPLDIAMKSCGMFTDDQIESAVQQQKAEQQRQADMQQQQMQMQQDHQMNMQKMNQQSNQQKAGTQQGTAKGGK